jgi:hypothetical protein
MLAASAIYVEVQPFDLSSCTIFVGKVLHQTNRNLVRKPVGIVEHSGM